MMMMKKIKKLKVPKRIMTMRVTSVSPGKLKVGKGFNVARRFSRFSKSTHRRSRSRSQSAIIPGRSWISTVRKSIIIRKPEFPRLHNKGRGSKNNNNKNIIIIHNNTSITSNEDQDNRASCVEVSLKEEDVTSIDSAAPPPNDHASTKDNDDQDDDADEQPQPLPQPTEHDEDQEIIRLREEKASIHIQSAFRGHLARRAFRALKGLVKLQALVRGVCVRRQARIALHCMNMLVRLQVRIQVQVRVRARHLLT